MISEFLAILVLDFWKNSYIAIQNRLSSFNDDLTPVSSQCSFKQIERVTTPNWLPYTCFNVSCYKDLGVVKMVFAFFVITSLIQSVYLSAL